MKRRGAFAFFGRDAIDRRVQKYCVYVLICPNTKKVRYVGITQAWKDRRATHTRLQRKPITPVQFWINDLIRDGKKPIFRVIVKLQSPSLCVNDSVFMERSTTARVIEDYAIARARQCGADLLNVDAIQRAKTRKPRRNPLLIIRNKAKAATA